MAQRENTMKKTRTDARGQIKAINPTKCRAITKKEKRCTYNAIIKGLCMTHYNIKLRGGKVKTIN
jgi:hypothetical protein